MIPKGQGLCSESAIACNRLFMITRNSRARKGGKKRGEVNGSMEEFEGRRREMLSTEEWCYPVINMLHHT